MRSPGAASDDPPQANPQNQKTPDLRQRFCGGAGNRTRVREGSPRPSFTCVVTVSPVTEFADSAATYLSLISIRLSRASSPDPAFVVTPFSYQDNLRVGRLYSFLGCESECVIVCSYKRPSIYVGQTRRHASGASRSTSKALRPQCAAGAA